MYRTNYGHNQGVSVRLPPTRVGKWFARLNDLEKGIVERLATALDGVEKREPAGTDPEEVDLAIDLTTHTFDQVYQLVKKAGHITALAFYVFVYLKIKHP